MLVINSTDTFKITHRGKQGYDGHCYRMIHYWPDQFPTMKLDSLTVTEVNATKKPFDALRSDSKPVSFALQYQGTWSTLVKNCGFTKEEAVSIETNYHKLYVVSNQYTQDKLQFASTNGYVGLAYGLRLRTPLLRKTLLNTRKTPNEAKAEARTAGNALSGQSYGLINTKASNEFMKRVRASKFKYDVQVCAHIHDAQYYLIRNNLETLKWVNDNLIDCMVNRIEGELPELYHEQVKLGAELDCYYPSWAEALTLSNNLPYEDLYLSVTNYIQELTND